MKERFYIPKPVPTGTTSTHPHLGDKVFAVYETDGGEKLLWSNEKPPPDIGTRITITINSIGDGEVVGYYESGGWLGLMVRPFNPPDWLVRQTKDIPATKPAWMREGIVTPVGAEVRIQ